MSFIEGPASIERIDLLRENKNISNSFSRFLTHELFVRPAEIKAEAGLIGSVLVDNETQIKVSQESLVKLKEKPIRLLSRHELQQLSQSLEVNGSNLWQIYTNKLIGENGLRRVLEEYYNSGNTLEVLRQEIMEHDIDFERDPHLRDMAPFATANTNGSNESSEVILNNLLEKAELSLGQANDENQTFPATNRYSSKAPSTIKVSYSDKLFISIIISLILIITLIYLTRH